MPPERGDDTGDRRGRSGGARHEHREPAGRFTSPASRSATRAKARATDIRCAAVLTEAHLCVDAARSDGLLDGGPNIDVDFCRQVIELAAELDITYDDDDLDLAVACVAVEFADGEGTTAPTEVQEAALADAFSRAVWT